MIDYTVHATAADIPPELFPNILQHVCLLGERSTLPHQYGPVGTEDCSRVSVYWAQACRENLFEGRTIKIDTIKHAVVFRELVVGHGSKRLTPIANMIAKVKVWHDMDHVTDNVRSWHHIVGALAGRIAPDKFKELRIEGPQRHNDSKFQNHHRKLRSSPHWGIPNLPSFNTPYRELRLWQLHLSSIRALLAILRHFSRLEVLHLYELTWNDSEGDVLALVDVPAQSRPLDTARSKRPLLSWIDIQACQNNALLFSQVAQYTRTNGTWPLQMLADADQTSIVRMIKGATDLCKEVVGDSVWNVRLSCKPPSK